MKLQFMQTPLKFSQGTGRFAAVVAVCFLALFAARLSAQDAPPANPSGTPDKSAGATLLKPSKAAEGGKNQTAKPEDSSSLWGWIGSLLFVLGLFLAAVWLIRRTSPRAYGLLPTEAFETLGRAPLANRQQAQLIRCGNKLLLIAAGVGGAEPLTEITDPAEVERLTELCRKSRPSPPAASLCQLFCKKEKQDG
jgi:flagellar biogenesis protein FliO